MKTKLLCLTLISIISSQAFSAQIANPKSINFDDINALQGAVIVSNQDVTMDSLRDKQGIDCSIKSNLWPIAMNKPAEQYYAELDVYRKSLILQKNRQYQVTEVKTRYYRSDITIDAIEMMNPAPDYSDAQARAFVDMKLVDSDKTEIEISCQGFSEDYGLKSTAFYKVKNAINYIFSK